MRAPAAAPTPGFVTPPRVLKKDTLEEVTHRHVSDFCTPARPPRRPHSVAGFKSPPRSRLFLRPLNEEENILKELTEMERSLFQYLREEISRDASDIALTTITLDLIEKYQVINFFNIYKKIKLFPALLKDVRPLMHLPFFRKTISEHCNEKIKILSVFISVITPLLSKRTEPPIASEIGAIKKLTRITPECDRWLIAMGMITIRSREYLDVLYNLENDVTETEKKVLSNKAQKLADQLLFHYQNAERLRPVIEEEVKESAAFLVSYEMIAAVLKSFENRLSAHYEHRAKITPLRR